ncbi:MAG: aminopeptidase P N-terminal domain-containing protein, partial [Bacteroidales bacterium]
MFSEKTYTERRNKLRKQLGNGLILIMGNNESPMNYPGNTYHFRQDSNFLYFFGLDFPGLAGVIDIDKNKDIIFGNDV